MVKAIKTPIIHRALFEIEIGDSEPANSDNQCDSGVYWDDLCISTWSVLGTDQIRVEKINLVFDGENVGKYSCGGAAAQHGSVWYSVENYTPMNLATSLLATIMIVMDCDQVVFEFAQGLNSIHSGMIRLSIRYHWVIGISGAEIPWLGNGQIDG